MKMLELHYPMIQFLINIYIHPLSKRSSYREIYRQIYTFVLLHVRPCAFFICYCPTCEKNRLNDKFFRRRVFSSNLTCRFEFFCFRKKHPPCNTNLRWRIIWLILEMRKTSREAADPRVIRRHRIGRLNAMASVASDEAFLLMQCI